MALAVVGKAFSVWVAILGLAIANGMFREVVLTATLGEVPGLVVSGVLLSCLILFVTYLSLPWLGVLGCSQLIGIGLMWLVLTLVFEFSFGLAQGKTLSVLLEAYSFEGGNIWPLVLLVTALAPWLAAKVRGWL